MITKVPPNPQSIIPFLDKNIILPKKMVAVLINQS